MQFVKNGKIELFPSINLKATGENIKLLREEKGLSVKQLASLLNIDVVQGIYHWQKGKSLPVLENLILLSDLFEKPIKEILVFQK